MGAYAYRVRGFVHQATRLSEKTVRKTVRGERLLNADGMGVSSPWQCSNCPLLFLGTFAGGSIGP
jgi:hypothetical protein